MGIIKLTKDDIISNKMTLKKGQMSYDTALASSWGKDAKTSFETLQNYNTKLNNHEYLSSDDLKSYKSAMNSYVENNNRLRRLNKILGQGYTDEQEKEWNNAIASLQSEYKEVSDYFSQFKDENEFKDTLAVIKKQEKMLSENVEAGMADINTILSDEKLTALKEEKAIIDQGITISHRDHGIYLGMLGYSIHAARNRLTELEKEIAAIEEPAMQKKEYLKQAKYLQNYFYLTQNDVSLNELKSHLSDEDPIAYTSPDGQNITWKNLYDYKKHEQDLYTKYEKYSAMPDWSEKSKYYQNNTKKTVSDVTSLFDKDMDWQYENIANYFHMPNKEDKYYSMQMTDKEKKVFNYIYHTQGEDAAYKWHDSIVDILKKRADEQYVENVKKFAKKVPVLSDTASILANTFAGAEYIGNFLAGNGVEKSKLATFAQTVRSTRAEQVNWEIGNFDVFDFLYNTGMSMADSAVSMAVFGNAGGLALGLSAAAQGTNDALNRGLNNTQAFWNGLASGTFEMLFETVSIGQFSALKESLGSGIKNIAKNIGRSMLVNASEEAVTEIANIVYDTVINTDFSDCETKIRAYVASGMTPEEAENQVKSDMTRQVAESAVSGALMGFGFGALGGVASHIKAKAIENAYSKSDINSLINRGLSELDTNAYALAQQAQSKINSGKSLSAQEIVDLQQAVTEAVIDSDISKIKQAVETRLVELGEGKSAPAVADAIAKQFSGQKLTASEKSALKNSTYGQRVVNEISPINIALGGYSSEWTKNIGTELVYSNIYNREAYDERLRSRQAFEDAYRESGNAQKNTAENSDIKYSIIKTSKMSYLEQLRLIEKRQINGSNSLYIGEPSQQLQKVGLSNAPFAMNQSDYRKSRRKFGNNKNYSSHAVPYEFFENMPQYFADAPLLIDNGEKVSVITSYPMNDTKGQASYIIGGVWQNQQMGNDTANLVKSVYPLDDFVTRIAKAAEEGKLVVVNKNKAEQMLATIGIQPSKVSRIVSLTEHTISQKTTNVNPADKEFLKYIPDELLRKEQQTSKNIALSQEKETLLYDNPKPHKWFGNIEESVPEDSIPNPNENIKENGVNNSDRDYWQTAYSDNEVEQKNTAGEELANKAYSNVQEMARENLEIYTEAQYNNFGWVRYNNVLSAAEYNTLLSRYADYKHNKDNYPTTRFGEAVIYSFDYPNILMYVKGAIESPQITKILKIDSSIPDTIQIDIQKEISYNERNNLSLPWENVTSVFGEESIAINKKRDFSSFQEYKRRRKREFSGEDNPYHRNKQNGTRSGITSKTTDKSEYINETEQKNTTDEGDVRFSDRNRYWYPNMSKSEITYVRRIAKYELDTTDNYIDDENKWLYNVKNGNTYFALYTTTDVNEPTVLYASKGKRAEIEHQFLIEKIGEEVDNDGNIDKRAERIGKLFSSYGYVISGQNVSNRNVVGGRSNDRNVTLYIKNSRIRPSEALFNCLRNIREVQKRNGVVQYYDRYNESVEKYDFASEAFENTYRESGNAQKNTAECEFDDSVIDYDSKTTDSSRVNWNSLTLQQREAVKFAKLFSKATGVNIKFIKSTIEGVEYKGENGRYDPEKNIIYIDVYAGRIDTRALNDSIIPTLSHELTHWMKYKSPVIYNSISENVIKTLAMGGRSINDIIENERKRLEVIHEKKYSSEYAVDELVARACEDMLSNSNEARKLLAKMTATEQQNFIEKVKETFENLISWINDLLAHYKSDSAEAATLREYKNMLKKISKQWDTMLVDAIGVNQAMQQEGITDIDLGNITEKNTTDEGDVKLSERDYDYWLDRIDTISDEDALKTRSEITYLRIADATPNILQKYGAVNLPLIIRFDAMYLAQRGSGAFEGHYHHLGKDVMGNLLDYVSNPDAILKTVTKNKNGEDVVKLIALVSIPIKSGEALASIEINTLKDRGEGDELYNLVVTFFDFKENYLRNLFVKYGAEIKYKKETLSHDNPKLHKWFGTIEESVPKNSIPNPNENVKENYSKNSDRDYLQSAYGYDETEQKNTTDEGDVRFSDRNRYWYPNMSKSEITYVRRIAKYELDTTDNYIDDENKWLYNVKNGNTYFALYSTTDVNEPTVLYASKGKRAEIEQQYLINYLKKEVDVNGNIHTETGTVDRLLMGGKNTSGNGIVDSRNSMGGRSNRGDVAVYSKNSRIRPGEALLNCLRNIREVQKRNGVVQYYDRYNESVEKYDSAEDNEDRASNQWDLVNDYYYALTKSEWSIFYRRIAEQGHLTANDIGTSVAIVINDKLVIAQRRYIGKNINDYVVTDVYKLFTEDGDNYTLSLLKDELMKGNINDDQRRIYSFVDKVSKIDGRKEILANYNGNSTWSVGTVGTRHYAKGVAGIYGIDRKGLDSERVSFRDKSDISKGKESLNHSDRDYLQSVYGYDKTEKLSTADEGDLVVQQGGASAQGEAAVSGGNSLDLELSEPAIADITRPYTFEESIAAAISGEQLDTKQRRILDFAEQHFPNINVKFSGNMTKNGLWDSDSKTLLLNINQTVSGMYIEVFKHEFMHTLESKRLYHESKQFLFNNDTAFGVWVKVQCKTHGIELSQNATAKDTINALCDYYYTTVKNDINIAKKYRDAFTIDGAQSEMVADFFGEIMFNGKNYRTQNAQALADETFLMLFDENEITDFEASSMAALAEISEYKPNIFRQIVDWVKRLILKLRGTRIKADTILADELERNIKMLEDYVKQVYNSRDTKKSAQNGGGVRYSFESYNKHQIENWKNSKKIVLYDDESGLLDFVNKAIAEKDYKAKMYFGTIGKRLAEKIKEKTSLDLFGRNVTLRADNVRKILKPESHGDMARDKKKKHVAVQKSDFAKIIDVMGSPDIIELSSKEYEGKPAVVFAKNIDEKKVTVIAVDSGGSLDLFIQTMYIGKNKGSIADTLNGKNSEQTFKTTVGTAPTNNILHFDKIVQTEKSNGNNNSNPQFAVNSQMQQLRYNREAYDERLRSRQAFEDAYRESAMEQKNTAGEEFANKAYRNVQEMARENLEIYTEAQYNNFGWVRYNDVLSAKEYSALLSRYADYKYNKDNYPTTRFGEAVIFSFDYPNILMYVKGAINSPQITKNFKTKDSLSLEMQSEIQEEILHNERRHLPFPYETIINFYGEEVFSIFKARNYETFRQIKSRAKGESGKGSNTVSEIEQNGTRGSITSKATDKSEYINETEKENTTSEGDVKFMERENLESYTETQYNNFGWVRYNNVLSATEYNTLLSRYADYKYNKDNYPTTRFGEAVIYSFDYPNILMYVKGAIRSPQITKVLTIDSELPLITQGTIQKEILSNERKQLLFPYENVTDLFGEGCFAINKKRDFSSFQEYKRRRKREFSGEDNPYYRNKQNGTRSGITSKTTDKSEYINETEQKNTTDEGEFVFTENGPAYSDSFIDRAAYYERLRSRQAFEDAYRESAMEQKNTAQNNGMEFKTSLQNNYDYIKSFAQQIDDYKSGKIPNGDTLLVGVTPELFQSIGFNALPMTINTTHVDYALNGTKDTDHHLGETMLKQLPKSIKDPVAIFISQTKGNSSVVALLNFEVNGKQTVAPIVIDGFGFQNNIRIDSNAITSVYGKGSAINQLYQAAQDEANGKFSLLYVNKKEADSLLQSAGHQLSGGLIPRNGFYHSIRENGSPVKSEYSLSKQGETVKNQSGLTYGENVKLGIAPRRETISKNKVIEDIATYKAPNTEDETNAQSAENLSIPTDSEEPIINKLTGKEISKETYEILKKLEYGEAVTLYEMVSLPEIVEAKENVREIIDKFIADNPNLKDVPIKYVGTHLIDTAERVQLRDNILQERLESGSFTSLDSNGNEVYNGSVKRGKRIDIVIGLAAAGKSTAIVNPLSQYYKSVVVDSDIIKGKLPEFNKGWGATLVHEESSAINMRMLRDELLLGNNIVLPIVGVKMSSVENYINSATEAGYEVHLHLNELNSSKAMGRMLRRYFKDGRFIPPEISFKNGDKPTKVYEELKNRGDLNGYSRWNNDVAKGQRPTLTEVSGNNRTYAEYSNSWRAVRGTDAYGNDSGIQSEETQTNQIANINEASSTDGVFFDDENNNTKNSLYEAGHDYASVFSLPRDNKNSVYREYSYENLVNKPDMVLTVLGDNVPDNRADIVAEAKKNAVAVGKVNDNGSISVYVDDIKSDVILATKGLRHAFRRTKALQDNFNVKVTLKAGEILKNSIRINDLIPTKENAYSSYVLIGAAKDIEGNLYIVQSVVNNFNNDLISMDVLYAINAKKEELAATKSPRFTAEPLSVTSSTISISNLLDHVNKYFPDILPESVLKHYKYTARSDGKLGESALFSVPRDNKNSVYKEYSYENLVKKPDMVLTVLGDNVPDNRADIVAEAKKNAAAVGKVNDDGSISVYVNDIKKYVIIGKRGLVHGLDRRFSENAAVTLYTGEIIKNSIKINELTPAKQEATESYVLIGAAIDQNETLNIVRFIVNKFNNDLIDIEVLYAINTKKESTAVLNAPLDSIPDYRTTISISNLLDYVNKYFPDILPESVLKHYKYTARPDGKLGESALFSIPKDSASEKGILKNRIYENEYDFNEKTFKDYDSFENESLNSKNYDHIKSVCNNLGRQVVFEDLRKYYLKGYIISPDGYIDKDGVIHLNIYSKNPISFVLKHELTHFGESAKKGYADFVDAVQNSSMYYDWLVEKTGVEYWWDALDKYKQDVLDSDPSIVSIDDPKIMREIIADFAGDMLFTEDGSGMTAIASNLEVKQRNKFIQFILDFISFIKKKLNGNNFMNLQLSVLEDGFNRMISEASNKSTSNVDLSAINKISYCFVRCTDNERIDAAEKMRAKGHDIVSIWREYGIIKDPLGNWLYELDIRKYNFYVKGNAKIANYGPNPNIKEVNGVIKSRLKNFVQWRDLFERFPELEKAEVVIQYATVPESRNTIVYLADVNRFIIDKYLYDDCLNNNDPLIKTVLIEQIQRAIQFLEGRRMPRNINLLYEMEQKGKLPFSERYQRNLTSKEVLDSMYDEKEAKKVGDRQALRSNLVYYRDKSMNDLPSLKLYEPDFNTDETFVFNDKGKLSTLKKYDASKRQHYYVPQIKPNDVLDTQENTDTQTSIAEDDSLVKAGQKEMLEKGENTRRMKSYLLSKITKKMSKKGEKRARANNKIVSGNEGFLTNCNSAEEGRYTINQRFSNDVLNKPLINRDTAGRILDDSMLSRLEGTGLKNQKGEPLSLFYTSVNARDGFNQSHLGLVMRTEKACIKECTSFKDMNPNARNLTLTESYAVLKNPLFLPYDLYNGAIYDVIFRLVNEDVITLEECRKIINTKYAKEDLHYNSTVIKKLRDKLKSLNYDSIIFIDETVDPGSMAAIVFDREQVIPVARNGVLIKNNGVRENVPRSETEVEKVVVENGESSQKVGAFLRDVLFNRRNKWLLPDNKIKAGSSGCFDRNWSDIDEAKTQLNKIFLKNAETEPSGYDTVNRELSKKEKAECERSVLKDDMGNRLSFYQSTLSSVNIAKQIDDGLYFKTFNDAVDDFISRKTKNPATHNGIITEYELNIINPLIVHSETGLWNTLEIANQLLEAKKISPQDHSKLLSMKAINKNTYNNLAANYLREKIKLNGFDSIVLLSKKDNKVTFSVIPFYENQVVRIAENGVLKNDSTITPQIEADYNSNYNSVTINPERVAKIDVEEFRKQILNATNNTQKLQNLTEALMYSKQPVVKGIQNIIAGNTGWLEKTTADVRLAFERFNAYVNGDKLKTPLSATDTAGRIVSAEILNKFSDTVCKNEKGELLSLYIYNRFGENKIKHSQLGMHLSTIVAEHDKYLNEKQSRPNLANVVYEEAYVNVKNPYFMKTDSNNWTPKLIATQLYEEGIISRIEYKNINLIQSIDSTSYNSPAVKNLKKLMRQKGFDSIVYMNEYADPGSMAVIVFDNSQIEIVAQHSITQDGEYINKADLKIEPAFYISENEDENFVEKSRKDIIDIKSYINYNEDEIITDGSHLVDGKLKPNVIYRTGGYDYIYCTDALGRICKAFTINLQLTKRRNRRKNNPNTPGKEIGDHAGHLIGDRFEGSPDIDNEVSQSKLVNLSEYKKIENKWAKALKQGKNVSVSIEVQYEGDSMRPSGFVIEYFIDGVKNIKTIKN